MHLTVLVEKYSGCSCVKLIDDYFKPFQYIVRKILLSIHGKSIKDGNKKSRHLIIRLRDKDAYEILLTDASSLKQFLARKNSKVKSLLLI